MRRRKFRKPVHCKKFLIKKFGLTELDTNNKFMSSSYFAYPRYNDSLFIFQTDFIKFTQYDMPLSIKKNKCIYTNYDPEQGRFIEFPLDPKQNSCQDLKSMFKKIDEYMQENKKLIFYHIPRSKSEPEIYKKRLFASPKKSFSAYKLYKYIPLIRTEYSDDFEYCIMKFDIDYNTKNIRTAVFRRNSIGDREPERLWNIKTLTDMDNLLRMVSCVRVIAQCNAMYAEKKQFRPSLGRYYRITTKIIQMEVIMKHITSLQRVENENDSIEDEKIELMRFLNIL